MTVKELIEKLQHYDQYSIVALQDSVTEDLFEINHVNSGFKRVWGFNGEFIESFVVHFEY